MIFVVIWTWNLAANFMSHGNWSVWLPFPDSSRKGKTPTGWDRQSHKQRRPCGAICI